jgi:hypothetical protein
MRDVEGKLRKVQTTAETMPTLCRATVRAARVTSGGCVMTMTVEKLHRMLASARLTSCT